MCFKYIRRFQTTDIFVIIMMFASIEFWGRLKWTIDPQQITFFIQSQSLDPRVPTTKQHWIFVLLSSSVLYLCGTPLHSHFPFALVPVVPLHHHSPFALVPVALTLVQTFLAIYIDDTFAKLHDTFVVSFCRLLQSHPSYYIHPWLNKYKATFVFEIWRNKKKEQELAKKKKKEHRSWEIS